MGIESNQIESNLLTTRNGPESERTLGIKNISSHLIDVTMFESNSHRAEIWTHNRHSFYVHTRDSQSIIKDLYLASFAPSFTFMDERMLDLMGYMGVASLGSLVVVSRAVYVYAHVEELWKALVVQVRYRIIGISDQH